MQIKFFTIPIMGGEALAEELNIFLRSKKILQVEQQLVNEGQGSTWCFCIRYVEDNAPDKNREKVDFKEILNPADFERFSALREIRKKIAMEEDIPAFSVFSNWELVELAKMKEITSAGMKKVKGIGEKKVEKYGKYFLTKPEADEKS